VAFYNIRVPLFTLPSCLAEGPVAGDAHPETNPPLFPCGCVPAGPSKSTERLPLNVNNLSTRAPYAFTRSTPPRCYSPRFATISVLPLSLCIQCRLLRHYKARKYGRNVPEHETQSTFAVPKDCPSEGHNMRSITPFPTCLLWFLKLRPRNVSESFTSTCLKPKHGVGSRTSDPLPVWNLPEHRVAGPTNAPHQRASRVIFSQFFSQTPGLPRRLKRHGPVTVEPPYRSTFSFTSDASLPRQRLGR